MHIDRATGSPDRGMLAQGLARLSPDRAAEFRTRLAAVIQEFDGTDIDGEPLPQPVTLGLIRLDGADTVLMHRLIDVDGPAIGDRVTARVRTDRTGSILDIEGFAPEGA